MKSNEIQSLFNQLAGCVQAGQTGPARRLPGTIFTALLKSVYAQVRGQASAAVMRGLLEREIEIGGENGDYRDFDSGQMVDLFIRGQVTRHLESRMARGPSLALAMDVDVIAQWLAADAHEDGSPRLASVRFVHAWLRLFAEEAGILDPDNDAPVGTRSFTESSPKMVPPLADAGQPYTDPITGMNFVFVPGGTFAMGDTFNDGVEDEKPVHEVTLSAFHMAAGPVTQAQWNSLMTENPSNFVADDHPVEQVTLDHVMMFVDKLNAASPSGLRFDLPSEAQWEYAARSGGKAECWAGGQDPEGVAWFEGNNTGATAPVGQKAPNGLGLYDMSGNVWEWCRDVYDPQAYNRHQKKDPVVTRGDADRVIRGGSWHLDAWSARCSRRFRFNPELFGPALGFRLVMML